MSFFEGQQGETKRESRFRSWRDTFVQLTPDEPVVIRVLEPKADTVVWKHWIPQARNSSGRRGTTIPCPGMSKCPICKRNTELGDRNHPEYLGASRKYVVNVLDVTKTKTCPLCNTKNTGRKCSYDDNDLKDVPQDEPVVRLLEGTQTLFQHLATLEESIVEVYDPGRPSMYWSHRDAEVQAAHEAGETPEVPVGITAYDVKLTTVKVKGKRVTTPVAVSAPDYFSYEQYADQLIPLDEAYLSLNAVEIQELLNGGSLVEVLKARHSSDESSGLGVEVESAL